ncbi:MAG: hypothetical protein OEY86_18825 [Nitrospira sp.]|nr:hypothetical protein [Nitrospira sp.]
MSIIVLSSYSDRNETGFVSTINRLNRSYGSHYGMNAIPQFVVEPHGLFLLCQSGSAMKAKQLWFFFVMGDTSPKQLY